MIAILHQGIISGNNTAAIMSLFSIQEINVLQDNQSIIQQNIHIVQIFKMPSGDMPPNQRSKQHFI